MATVTIDATTPSASVNWAVLRSLCQKLLELHRRNSLQLGEDEYRLVWEVAYAATDGETATGTTTQAVITY